MIDGTKHTIQNLLNVTFDLFQLIGALTVEAEGIKGEVAAKRQELDRVRSQVLTVDKQLEEKQLAMQRITQTHGDISQLSE